MRDWLHERFGPRVRYADPLSRHTSFRIGGPADAWVEVASAEEILDLQRLGRAQGVRRGALLDGRWRPDHRHSGGRLAQLRV